MAAWQRWLEHPEHVWARQIFFQIHLWVGAGVGMYIMLMSVTGSAIVFRNELSSRFARKPFVLGVSGRRMSPKELMQGAQRLYPGFSVDMVFEPTTPDQPVTIDLESGEKRIERIFNPYTGADLGDPLSGVVRSIEWLVDLHENLLFGDAGRIANGIGAICVVVLCLTGAVIWWPGIAHWRRSLKVDWRSTFPRINWDLHSALGFWCFLFVLLWGVSGAYFAFPQVFNALEDFWEPAGPSVKPRLGDWILLWLSNLHFGRFDWFTEALWTLFGLVPAVLVFTGMFVCCRRIVYKRSSRPEHLINHGLHVQADSHGEAGNSL